VILMVQVLIQMFLLLFQVLEKEFFVVNKLYFNMIRSKW
jgi:hypothetical protein